MDSLAENEGLNKIRINRICIFLLKIRESVKSLLLS